MTFEVRESIHLGRFIYDHDWTPVKGTYILPLRFFAPDRTSDPNDYLEVIKVLDVAGTDFAISRGGGLFVRDKGQYNTREQHEKLVELFNLLLAEFAFQGLASHPVTDIEIQSAKLIGKHVSITGGWGSFADRTWGPYVLLAMHTRDLGEGYKRSSNHYWPVNFYWRPHDPSVLERISGTANALRLREISSTLPALLVAATYHATRHSLAEGIVTSWIVCEELLSFLWDQHVSQLPEKERRDRLKDSRTYSAAVRLEVLLTNGSIGPELCSLLQRARGMRNALAHRSVTSQESADLCSRAMREMLTHVGFSTQQMRGFSYQSGGSGMPRTALEPNFPFK
jgi:hypothetical protein